MKNVVIAKKLVKIARELVAMSKFTDNLGEDPDNTSEENYSQYSDIVREIYNGRAAEIILWNDNMAKQYFKSMGGSMHTLGNGNLLMPYAIIPGAKQIAILGLVSKSGKTKPSDARDLLALADNLYKKLSEGYEIQSDCNSHSMQFFEWLCKKHSDIDMQTSGEFNPLGDANDKNELWKHCVLLKK